MSLVGHSSPAFCHEPVAEVVRRVHEDGFDVWEVVAEGGHDLSSARRDLEQALGSWPVELQVHAPLSDCNLGSLVPQAWERSVASTEACLRAAAGLGAKLVTIHPGNHTPLSRGHYDRLHGATRAAVRRLASLARDLGLTLCLENVPNNWAFETDSVAKLLDLVEGTEVALCFDLGHAFCAGRLEEFPPVAPRVRNVHLHDNRGDHDAHLGLDEGRLPWRESLAVLERAGYRGPIVIESNGHDSGRGSLEKLRAWRGGENGAPARGRGPRAGRPATPAGSST